MRELHLSGKRELVGEPVRRTTESRWLMRIVASLTTESECRFFWRDVGQASQLAHYEGNRMWFPVAPDILYIALWKTIRSHGRHSQTTVSILAEGTETIVFSGVCVSKNMYYLLFYNKDQTIWKQDWRGKGMFWLRVSKEF